MKSDHLQFIDKDEQAGLRVGHVVDSAPDAVNYDVSTGIDGSDPTVSDFVYKESINGLYVEEGSYYVTITVANQPDVVAIDSAPVSVVSGSVYQVVAIDDGNNGGFNLLVSETTD